MENRTIAVLAGISTLALVLFLINAKKVQASPIIEAPDPKVEAGPLGLGDVDEDGWVSKWDYDLVEKYRFGKVHFTDEQFRRADINQDGAVTLSDMSGIMLIMMGKEPAQ